MIPKIYHLDFVLLSEINMLTFCLKLRQTPKSSLIERKSAAGADLPTYLSPEMVDTFLLELARRSGQGREGINYEW
jgi:acyl CoA:acetate/3-ketoacid CoA transferase alpha subunit